MTMWLPRRRTSTNPCDASKAQTSRPESTRSLGNVDLDFRYVHFAVHTAADFIRRRAFEKQLKSFLQVFARVLDRIALAGDVQLRAERDVAVAFALDHRGELHV